MKDTPSLKLNLITDISAYIESGKETIGIPKHPETLKIDEIRKMTRKNTSKRGPKKDRDIDGLRDSIKGMEPLLGKIILDFSRWRDVKSEFSNKIGTRRDSLHDKLSESA